MLLETKARSGQQFGDTTASLAPFLVESLLHDFMITVAERTEHDDQDAGGVHQRFSTASRRGCWRLHDTSQPRPAGTARRRVLNGFDFNCYRAVQPFPLPDACDNRSSESLDEQQ